MAGGDCRLFQTDGVCMTVAEAFLSCQWPAKQGWPSAVCGDGNLCCIDAPEAADPPPAEDRPKDAIADTPSPTPVRKPDPGPSVDATLPALSTLLPLLLKSVGYTE